MITPEQSKLYSLDEFIAFALDNADREFELVNGKIVEMKPRATIYSGMAHLISFAIHLFCRDHNLTCHTSGAFGAYNILEHVIAPDFAYKAAPMSDDYPDPIPPLWAVEIVSPTDKAPNIRAKRQIYRQAGILYWEMYPESRSIDVYAPGKELQTFGIDQTLDGGDVLPGFTLPVRELFAE
jgi:Uma2 family endonuclease